LTVNKLHENDYFYMHSPFPKVYALAFKTREEMAKSLVRFRDNSDIEGFNDYCGFMFSHKHIKLFIDAESDFLNERERRTVDALKMLKGKYYLIAYQQKDLNTLEHECAHVFFDMNKPYRDEVKRILGQYNLTALNKILKQMGYTRSAYKDELNSIISTSSDKELEDYKMDVPKELRKRLQSLFQRECLFALDGYYL